MITSRIIPVITAGLLLSASVFAATPPFTDVPEDHENGGAIDSLQKSGVVEGYADGSFRPSATINRAEFVKIVVKANYSEDEIDDLLMRIRIAFMPDVVSGSWYERYVTAARGFGMVSGYPDGTFKPNATINFAEASKIIAEAYDLDIDSGRMWYEGYVRALADENAIPTSIDFLKSHITRGEMAEIMYRLENNVTTKPSRTYEYFLSAENGGCVRAGCSAQLCVDVDDASDIVTTCEWREEYACYQNATCERQDNGICRWTPSPALSSCLHKPMYDEVYDPSCAVILCPESTTCSDGKCVPFETHYEDNEYNCPDGFSQEDCIQWTEGEGERKCADYVRNGVTQRQCAACGNNVCEAFEKCSASSCTANGACTKDCGPLHCPTDCD